MEYLVGGMGLLMLASLLIIAYTNGMRRGRRQASVVSQELNIAHTRIRELESQLRDKDAIINFQRQSTDTR